MELPNLKSEERVIKQTEELKKWSLNQCILPELSGKKNNNQKKITNQVNC